jgi:hypothetical protein
MQRITVDILEEAEEIREEEIGELVKAQDELVEEIKQEYDSFEEVPEVDQQAYDSLEEQITEARGVVKKLESIAEEYDGSEFVIEELSTGALASIQDEVSEKSFDYDVERGEISGGTPKQGYGMVETLRHSIVKQPHNAPTTKDERGRDVTDPGGYPHQLGIFLFEKINNINTTGEVELGNSSLRDRMTT